MVIGRRLETSNSLASCLGAGVSEGIVAGHGAAVLGEGEGEGEERGSGKA